MQEPGRQDIPTKSPVSEDLQKKENSGQNTEQVARVENRLGNRNQREPGWNRTNQETTTRTDQQTGGERQHNIEAWANGTRGKRIRTAGTWRVKPHLKETDFQRKTGSYQHVGQGTHKTNPNPDTGMKPIQDVGSVVVPWLTLTDH